MDRSVSKTPHLKSRQGAPLAAPTGHKARAVKVIAEEPPIQVKRVYDSHDSSDGARVLVERLWPRGIKKTALKIDAWLKDAAPSTELRRWFNHDPAKWAEFQRRYRAELDGHRESWVPILAHARRGRVTLLYSAHDTEHNNAVVLRDYLNSKLRV